MFIRESLFIWAKPRKIMKGYSWSRQDFRELLITKYFTMEEEKATGCLGLWEQDTDYVLCNGDEDLLPPLVKKDEIRFEYNQWNQERSRNSCTIFAAMWMLSDLINYEFSLAQLKEVDELSYTTTKYPTPRKRWEWWYVKYAVDLVADRYNNSKLSEKYWKVAYYRVSKYDNEIIENVIDKLYTIDGNHGLNAEYNKDRKDWMVDGTNFWTVTNWHSVDVIKKSWQRSVKNSYKGSENNIYGLKHKLSEITNFGSYFYVYTIVGEDNMERIKKLNEMKAKILNGCDINSELWKLSGSEFHKNKLHDMNDFYREWVAYIDSELKTLV